MPSRLPTEPGEAAITARCCARVRPAHQAVTSAGGAPEPGAAARAASAGSSTPAYRCSTWSRVQHPVERRAHRLLRGDHVGHPGVEVGLEAANPQRAVVAGGLPGRRRLRPQGPRSPGPAAPRSRRRGGPARRPASSAAPRGAAWCRRARRRAAPRGAAPATSRPRDAPWAGSPGGTPSRRRPPSPRSGQRRRRTSPGRRPAPRPPAGRPRRSGCAPGSTTSGGTARGTGGGVITGLIEARAGSSAGRAGPGPTASSVRR